jgi:hypothetical protein
MVSSTSPKTTALRFALYYAPQSDSLLSQAATAWLGRDQCKLNRTRISPAHLDPQRFVELTKQPYHYGFHGTLKPPFRLSDDSTEQQLTEELQVFCTQRYPFRLPAMEVAWIGSFLCLRPAEPSPEMHLLARELVIQFDRFRAPLSAGELAKRRAQWLTKKQDNLLLQYGYPYLMDEFRFHLTLTSFIDSTDERIRVEKEARRHFSRQLLNDIRVEGIALFTERDGNPMTQQNFFHFGG